jgi:hypothetical protein
LYTFRGLCFLILLLTILSIYLSRFVNGSKKKLKTLVNQRYKSKLKELLVVGIFIIWGLEVIFQSFGLGFHVIPVGILYIPFINDLFLSNSIAVIGVIVLIYGYIDLQLSIHYFENSVSDEFKEFMDLKTFSNEHITANINRYLCYMEIFFIGIALINHNLFYALASIALLIGIEIQHRLEKKSLNKKFDNIRKMANYQNLNV